MVTYHVAKKAYGQAFVAGRLPFMRSRVMLIEAGRASNTFTMLPLLDKEFQADQASTLGVKAGDYMLGREIV